MNVSVSFLCLLHSSQFFILCDCFALLWSLCFCLVIVYSEVFIQSWCMFNTSRFGWNIFVHYWHNSVRFKFFSVLFYCFIFVLPKELISKVICILFNFFPVCLFQIVYCPWLFLIITLINIWGYHGQIFLAVCLFFLQSIRELKMVVANVVPVSWDLDINFSDYPAIVDIDFFPLQFSVPQIEYLLGTSIKKKMQLAAGVHLHMCTIKK